MKVKLVIFLVTLFFANLSFGQPKTFIRDYVYRASDNDSKVSSRHKALNEVKALLIEELGVYIQSYVNYQIIEENQKITKEFFSNEIKTFSAGYTETKILEENWDGYEYFIKAEIKADPEEVLKRINQTLSIRKSSAVIDSLNILLSTTSKEIDNRNKEIQSLNTHLETNKKQLQSKEKELNILNNQLSEAKKQLAIYQTQERLILSNIEEIEQIINKATRNAINNVRIGMTSQEIIKVCGNPRSTDKCLNVLLYNYGSVWVFFESNIVGSVINATDFKGACYSGDYYRKSNILN